MLYYLLYDRLYPAVSGFRVFRYVTFRTTFASITAFLLCVALGPWLIAKLREFQIGQYIREEGPKSHQKKAGTPTMGGVLIVISIVVPTLLWADLRYLYVWIAVLCPAGICRHWVHRRLREGAQAAQPGSEQPRQASAATAGGRAADRGACGNVGVQQLRHQHERAVL